MGSLKNRKAFAFCDSSGNIEWFDERYAIGKALAFIDRITCQDGTFPEAIIVDLGNCPEFIYLIIASALTGLPIVALNHRLSESEKMLRLKEIEGISKKAIYIDATWVSEATACYKGNVSDIKGITPLTSEVGNVDYLSFQTVLHGVDPDKTAVVMFTSGTTGKPKAAALSWENLLTSACESNESLSCDTCSMWQASLPLYHVGGLQVVLRSVVAGCPFILYERFDAFKILKDASTFGATHVSVVDKMLREMLALDRCDQDSYMKQYSCILLGGSAPNHQTLSIATEHGARVFASYGMTETSSQIANMLVNDEFTGGLALIGQTRAKVLDPDENGVGQLAVKSKCVVSSYLNANISITEDGYFVTGDTARIENGLLYVAERLDDMFISGGENVYPSEIENVLKRVKGVSDCFVFGRPDEKWGRRPVALLETKGDARSTEQRARESADVLLSPINRPDILIAVEELPRMGIGKLDRAAAKALFEDQLSKRDSTSFMEQS